MANFCSNCGSSVNDSMTFCPACGHALHKSAATQSAAFDTAQSATYAAQPQNTGFDAGSAAIGALGTLVAVNLIGGLTRQLYFRGGRYYLDPYCRRPFGNPHLILGRRMLGRPFMPPPPPFVPRPPMGMHPPMHRGPMSRPPMGPRGGGWRGRR